MVAKGDISEQIIRTYLKTGQRGSLDPEALAAACDQLIRRTTQQSVAEATKLATRFVAHARQDNLMPLATALRAFGWTGHVGGKYRKAEQAYLEARTLLKRDPHLRARIDRILIDVYMYLGNFAEARKRARLALTTFDKINQLDEAAKTRVNLANLFHRQDRHAEAREQYELALAFFENSDNILVRALCQYNLANTLVQLIDFDAARELYQAAEQNFLNQKYDLYANECRYGLAWLHMLQGEFDQALRGLAECERQYQQAGQPKGVLLCRLDRAEACLGLNLFREARSAARDAEKRARKLGIGYESAKAAFFVAKAAYAQGRTAECRAALKRARTAFRKEKNEAFLAAVDLFDALTTSSSTGSQSMLKRARSAFARAQLPLWEAICDLQVLSNQLTNTTVADRLEHNPAVKAIPHLYAHWQTLLGDGEAARNPEAAVAHWRQAAGTLDRVRAKLPPVELRSTFLQNRQDPYLRLIHGQADRDPLEAALWLERYKTAGIWAVRDYTPELQAERGKALASLTELADQVTALASHIGTTTTVRESAPATDRAGRLADLYGRAREELIQFSSRHERRHAATRELSEAIQTASHQQPIIQFHCVNGDLLAFVHERGATRTVRYSSGNARLEQLLGCWRILLNRQVRTAGRRTRDLRDEHDLFTEIGSFLWPALEVADSHQSVLIIPDGRMANLPWLALRPHGRLLAETKSILLAPSFRHHQYAVGRPVAEGGVEIFLGDQTGLSRSFRETGFLRELAGASATMHDPCRRIDWPTEGSARLWHYGGHAELRSDNPFYSSLQLADGPLFAADFRLRSTAVNLVTLAACRTGLQAVLPGEESTGLVRSLLEMGARNVIGSHWAVNDESTGAWMRQFYDLLFRDLPVGEALRQTSLHIREIYPSAYDWAAFSVFGAGRGGL